MNFQEFLNSKMKESGLGLKKLSELSGIALKHLENLNSGNFSDLPPAPYLHGYLVKISQILNLDGEELWNLFKKETDTFSSGQKDQLPQNRFLKKSSGKKLWLALAGILILIYVVTRFTDILGKPTLTIYYPEENLISTPDNEIVIRGKITGGDKVLVNAEEVPIGEEGLWFKNFSLLRGPNIIEIRAKKFLGREAKTTLQVFHEPPRESLENTAATSTPTSTNPN